MVGLRTNLYPIIALALASTAHAAKKTKGKTKKKMNTKVIGIIIGVIMAILVLIFAFIIIRSIYKNRRAKKEKQEKGSAGSDTAALMGKAGDEEWNAGQEGEIANPSGNAKYVLSVTPPPTNNVGTAYHPVWPQTPEVTVVK